MPRFLAPITVDREYVTGNETISGSETILGTTYGKDSYWTSVSVVNGVSGADAYFSNSVYSPHISGGVHYGDGSLLTGVAKLFSPAFEGIPTAPTAPAQTDTTQIATTQFVIANRGDRYLTTSSTSLALANNATYSLTAGTGLSYITSSPVTLVYDSTHYMTAVVLTYNSSTGAMTINSTNRTGTGTFSAWTVNAGSIPVVGGLLAGNNLSDVASPSAALINLGGFPTTGGTLSNGLTANVGTFNNILFVPTASAPSYQQGKLFYDSVADSLCYYNLTTNNKVHVGQEIQQQVKNSTNSTIPKGTPVYITGAFGEYAGIAPAKADSVLTSILIGVTNQDILSGQIGFVVTAGTITDIDTSSYASGNDMYLSPLSAGKMTAILPSAPNFAVQAGVCLYAHPTNGKMVVQNAYIGTLASTVIGAISIEQGGTGQTSASAAIVALSGLPITGGTLTNGLTGTRGVFTTSLSAPALSGTHYGDGSKLTGITRVLDWMTLVRGYNTTPTLLATIGTGEVYTYVYNSTPSNITYYRFIATDGDTDAFYTYFSGSTLSGLVASKSISI